MRPGWSDAAIEKFLGEPDKKRYNRWKKGGPKRCLFLRSKVAVVEESDEFWKFAIETLKNNRRRRKDIISDGEKNLGSGSP